MKKINWSIVLLFFLTSLMLSCTPKTDNNQKETDNYSEQDSEHNTDKEQTEDQSTAAISFETQKFGDDEIGASYPLMQGGDEAARKSINKVIEDEVFKLIYKEDEKDIEAALAAFKADSEAQGGMLSISINASKIYQKENLISFGLNWSAYHGGAHPNSASIAMNFDAKTGKRLSKDDLILDKEAFTSLVEQEFRKKVGIKEGASINSAGHDFEDEQFKLPNYMVYTEKGLELYYIPYEIAAYVMGGTDLMIPYDSLKGMLKYVD
jgi:hypothetical protein